MTREEATYLLNNLRSVAEGEEDEALDMAIEALSADRPTVMWKIDEYGIYHCPICHAINNTVYKSFCPNCGARMKGGDIHG